MLGKLFVLALLATFSSPLVAHNMQQLAISQAEDEVRKLERQWLDTYEQNDSSMMTKIVADDFMITFPNGIQQTKPDIMNMIKSPSSGPKMRFYTEEVKSRAYGDTVILSGKVVTEYMRDGKQVQEKSRYTDTYVKRNGRWQVVASHLSNVEEPKKQ